MSFLELVKSAFFEANNEGRVEAEKQLLQFRDCQVDEFFRKCVDGLSSNEVESGLRQAAGTLLKRCTSLSCQNGQYWLLLKPETKAAVKNALLSNLVANDPAVKRASSNQRVARTSIDNQETEKILYGICLGLKAEEQNSEIRLIALKALQDALLFMDFQFQNKIIRDSVANLLLQNVTDQNDSIRTAALRCLIDFSKQLWMFLNEYIQGIFVATSPYLICTSNDLKVLSIEVWYAIALELKDKNQKGPVESLNMCCPQLLGNMFENLIVNVELNDEEDDLEQEVNPQESAYKAVGAICDAVGNPCHSLFTAFIEKLLYDQDWMKRKAALLGFGGLVENRNNAQVKAFALSAIRTIMNSLNDKHSDVQKTSARVLSKVAEHYPEVYILHPNAVELINIILEKYNSKPVVAKHLITLTNFVTELLPKYPGSALFTQVSNILQYLAKSTDRNDLGNAAPQFINLCWVGILQLIYCISDAAQITQYLDEFQKQFVAIASSSQDNLRRQAQQSGLLSVMHACIVNLQNKPIKLDDGRLVELFNLVISFFQHIKDVTSDGLYCITAIACYQKKNFTSLLPQLVPYLEHCLKNANQGEAFRQSIYCLADIARAIQCDFSPYLSILDYLISCIQDQKIDREQKLHLYICIGDIILATGLASINSLPQIVAILRLGFASAVKFSLSPDTSLQDYADRLKEALVQNYICVVHAYNDQVTSFTALFETLPMIAEFLLHVCNSDLRPTVDFVRLSLNCLMDCLSFYRTTPGQDEFIKQFASSPLVMQLITVLKKYQTVQENQSALIYAKDMLASFGISVNLC